MGLDSDRSGREPMVELGLVLRPHGLSGEVRMMVHNPESDLLRRRPSLLLEDGSGDARPLDVQGVRGMGRQSIVKLAGIDDRDAADALRGARVLCPRSELPALADGEYYLSDLIGCTVMIEEEKLGEVEAVLLHPSVDSVLIRSVGGKLLEQPLVLPWLVEVDTERRCLRLSSREGLIE